MTKAQAKLALNAVFEELSNRSGIGSVLSRIRDDQDVYHEMYDACIKRIQKAIDRKENTLAEKYWNP